MTPARHDTHPEAEAAAPKGLNRPVSPAWLAFGLSLLAFVWQAAVANEKLNQVLAGQVEDRIQVRRLATQLELVTMRQQINQARMSVYDQRLHIATPAMP